MVSSRNRTERTGWIFGAPWFLFAAVVFAYPLALAVYMSVHDYFFAAPGAVVDRPFVGLSNYAEILVDPKVQRSLFNVGVFLAVNVPITVFGSLVLASALNRIGRVGSVLRVSYYAPYITATVALIGVWIFMFGKNGIVNNVLGAIAPDPSWLLNSALAMPMIALFVVWKNAGFYVLLYLAALQNIPKELYEAASTDGAGVVRRFVAVTIPGVRFATVVVLILSTLIGINLFTEPYLLTGGGGPDGASVTPVLLMYQRGIQQGDAGYAAALGVILLVVALAIAGVQSRWVGRSER